MPRSSAIRRPELGELEALIVALRAGSIGEASRRLGVSQPALSKRLRQLEAVCGARLLERSTSGVVATPAGARLATAALRVIDEVALLDDLIADLRGQSAPVRIASSPVIAESLLPELLAAARADLTGVPIELTAANSAVVRRLVHTGAADLGIAASADDEDPTSPTLAHDEVVVALPPGHPWIDRSTLTVADLAGTSLVMRDPRAHARGVFERALRDRGLAAAAPSVELGSTGAAVSAALETGTPAILSRLALGRDDRLAIRRLDDLTMKRRFAVLSNPEAVGRPGVVRVREALLDAVERVG